MKHYQLLIVAAITCCVMGCSSTTIYSHYQDLPHSGWEKDSVLSFSVDITDTLTNYNVIVSLRHGQDYPFQNIWFFVGGITPNGAVQPDTLEFYLANERGKWLGNGWGEKYEMPCLIQQNVRFPRKGEYTYFIHQGMRGEALRGVSEVGLIIEQAE